MFGKNVGALVENHIDGFLNYLAESESIDIEKLYQRYKEFENIPTEETVISKKPKRTTNRKKKEKKEEKDEKVSNGYNKMKLPELKSLCKQKGIKGTAKWRKADYVKALEDSENTKEENMNNVSENESLQSDDDNESMQNDLEELEQTFSSSTFSNQQEENFTSEQNHEIMQNLMTSSTNSADLGLDSSDDEIDPSKEATLMEEMFDKNPPENIYEMSIDELRKLCENKNIKPKKKTKRGYITALEENDNNDEFGENQVEDDEIF